MDSFILSAASMVFAVACGVLILFLIKRYKFASGLSAMELDENASRPEYLKGIRLREYVCIGILALNVLNIFLSWTGLQIIIPLITVVLASWLLSPFIGEDAKSAIKKEVQPTRSEWADNDRKKFEEQKRAFMREKKGQ